MGRMVAGVIGVFVAALVLRAPSVSAGTTAGMPSDFNGDGYADLAIGVPYENLGTMEGAGAVNVLYGSAEGLTAAGDQLWSQDSTGVKGVAHGARYDSRGESFGKELASGDFDADGFADLAIGVPQDRVGASAVRAGGVNVLYGSAEGLSGAGDQLWSQGNLPGTPGDFDWFGAGLAAADLNGDEYADLAIGANDDDDAEPAGTGTVTVLYGGPDGLQASDADVLTGLTVGIVEPRSIGETIAAGDLDADGFADLAVGTTSWTSNGAVAVLRGSAEGIVVDDVELWLPDTPGLGAPGAGFGRSLAVGDLDADSYGDLAIGIPAAGNGSVAVLYGSATGLTVEGNQIVPAPPGLPEDDDYGVAFGATLATGDFDGDGRDDLAVGAPQTGQRWGAVVAYMGSDLGLDTSSPQPWTQDARGVPGTSERGDRFGTGLASGNYGWSVNDDLAIGAPGEDVARGTSGRVTVLYGRSEGLKPADAQAWSQNSPGVQDQSEADDEFGWAICCTSAGYRVGGRRRPAARRDARAR